MKLRKITPAVILLLVLLGQFLPAAESKETKRVLILYSETKDLPAHELTDRGIRKAFLSNKVYDVHLYTEYLDVSRFGSPAQMQATADYLCRRYRDLKIDAIIAVYPAAVNLLLEEARHAFHRVPIVACEVNKSFAESLDKSPSRSFITGVIMAENITGVLDAALVMRPGTKQVALVGGTAPNDAYSNDVFRRGFKAFEKKLAVIDLTGLPMRTILPRVESLPSNTIILYTSIFKDGDGQTFVPRDALSLISRAANAPVFSLYDSYLGHGIVGGRLVSVEQQGRKAAECALRIFGGESPVSMPFLRNQGYVNLYDWRELKRWKIPENLLPAGSEIRYREHSLWEDHAQAIMGLACLLMIQTVLIFGLVINLRRRRKAEQALVESENQVRLAVSSAGAGLWSLDTGAGSVWVNNETRKMFGIAVDKEMGLEEFLTYVHPEDRQRVGRTIQQMTQSDQETRIEYRIVGPDGNVRWIASLGRMQRRPFGKTDCLMGVSVDITARKESELAAARHREALARVSRLASLGELSAAIAHQLNQPLTAILSNAQAAVRFLSRDLPDLGELRETVADIVEDDKRAREIIVRLRTLIRSGELVLNSIDLNQIVREAVGMAQDSAELHNIELRLDLREDLPPVEGDALHLQQVILNLIINGMEAMDGSEVQDRWIRIFTDIHDQTSVRVSVQDNGVGIDEANRDVIFQDFHTTKSEGLGLGLSICQSIIQAHSGRLWAENCPDGGAIFSFTIPSKEKEE